MRNFIVALLPERNFSPVIRYAGATAVVLLAVLVHEVLRRELAGHPVLLYFPAIFLAALLFDWGAGIWCTMLSVLASAFLFVEPTFSLQIEVRELVPLGIFTVTGCAIALATGALRDTVQQLASAESRQSLLLDELTHRIKNDLMMVTSVLSLQAKAEVEPAARAALESAIGRISAVARAHERLREQNEQQRVLMSTYVEALCRSITDLLRDVRPIAVRVHAHPFELSARQAISIGLIINELLTNALKYAFPPGRGGTIDVSVAPVASRLEIHVSDDGIGCPQASPGLGSRLVRLLAGQMGGTVESEPSSVGCHICVYLPLPELAARGESAGAAGAREGMEGRTA